MSDASLLRQGSGARRRGSSHEDGMAAAASAHEGKSGGEEEGRGAGEAAWAPQVEHHSHGSMADA